MLACPQELFFKPESNTDFNDKRPRQNKMNQLQQQMDHVSNKEKEEVRTFSSNIFLYLITSFLAASMASRC